MNVLCGRNAGDTAEQCGAVVLDRFSAVRNHVMTSKGAAMNIDAAGKRPMFTLGSSA